MHNIHGAIGKVVHLSMNEWFCLYVRAILFHISNKIRVHTQINSGDRLLVFDVATGL